MLLSVVCQSSPDIHRLVKPDFAISGSSPNHLSNAARIRLNLLWGEIVPVVKIVPRNNQAGSRKWARLQVVVVWYVASYRRSYTESDLNTVNYRMSKASS